MSYLKNPIFSPRRFCPFIFIKHLMLIKKTYTLNKTMVKSTQNYHFLSDDVI